MSFELYEKEQTVIAAARTLLENGSFPDASAKEHFESLLKAYEQLFRSTRRLIRLSDRNEEELNRIAKTLDTKNKVLEGLSAKLSKYLSPQLYNSIFTGDQDVALVTKRKKLTVFFSDLKDFTETTENLQPEDLTELLNTYLSEMSRIALEHGATIDKFIGDAMLMFLGDPETRGVKEDAAACVRMAIAMQRRMRDLHDVWRDKGIEKPFGMRIGINTGFCNVGNFGSADRMDYTIIGGEVNLASRLESSADPGSILMSYETYAHVKDLIHAEERKPMRVKGIAREIRPFAVTRIYEDPGSAGQFIRKETDGLNLLIDLDRLKDDARGVAINELEAALEQLKRSK